MKTALSPARLERALYARLLVEEALHAYGDNLDRGDLEAWASMFAPTSSYRLIPRENVELGLPIALMDCPTKEWIDDRATSILHASVYSPHNYRHLYSPLLVRETAEDRVTAQSTYAVYRTATDGDTELLSVGTIDAEMLLGADAPIARMTVTYDTIRVPGVLVFPL